MTKRRSTKRALLSSVVALLLCFTMLLGSTFAWFTDSVTFTNNKIQAGTLKIDLELLENGSYESVRDMEDPIFNYDLWEPGYTEVKTLKIVNAGNLALKYQLNVVAENADSILADVIDVYMGFNEITAESAEDLSDTSKWWKCGTLAEMMANPEGFTQGKLLPAGATYDGTLLGQNGVAIGEITATIALHMQESAGNEYQGLDLGAIDVNLFATQFTYEEDSFDHLYDKDAEYPVMTSEELVSDLKAGGEVVLGTDIIVDESSMEGDAFMNLNSSGDPTDTTLNLNGNTMTAITDNWDKASIRTGNGVLTIDGEGEVVFGASLMFVGQDSTVIINSGRFIRDDSIDCESGNSAIVCGSRSNGSIIINGGYFDCAVKHKNNDNCDWDGSDPFYNFNIWEGSTATIYGGQFVNWEPTAEYLAEGATVTSEVVDGQTIYTVVTAAN